MNIENSDGFDVIGLSAHVRNDEPAGIAALWARFHQSGVDAQMTEGAGSKLYCVYHDYEGDHAAPFMMTIGYRADDGAPCPDGCSRVSIPAQTLAVFEAKGPQPDALIATWQSIWQSDLDRVYAADFDTYDTQTPDRVTVRVGIKPR